MRQVHPFMSASLVVSWVVFRHGVLPAQANLDVLLSPSLSMSENELNSEQSRQQEEEECTLYMAESSILPPPGSIRVSNRRRLGVYTSVTIEAGQDIAEAEIVVPWMDELHENNNLPWWQEYLWNPTGGIVASESSHAFHAGVGALIQTAARASEANVQRNLQMAGDSAGLHRNSDAGAGAFTSFHSLAIKATKRIDAGSELFLTPLHGFHEESTKTVSAARRRRLDADMDTLEENQSLQITAKDYADADRIVQEVMKMSPHVRENTWAFLWSGMSEVLQQVLPQDAASLERIAKVGTQAYQRGDAASVVELSSLEQQKEGDGASSMLTDSNLGCMGGLYAAPSSIPQAGRGAFTKRFVPSGSVIAPTPVLHIDREELTSIVQHHRKEKRAKHEQLLLNYCFGHANSSVVLLPYGPIVNLINHDGVQPNAELRWTTKSPHVQTTTKWLQTPTNKLLSADPYQTAGLMMEFVALRDIELNEEITVDYGDDWEEAWANHVTKWRPPKGKYISAAQLLEKDRLRIRSMAVQKTRPYPSNVETACYYNPTDADAKTTMTYNKKEHFGCLRPCQVLAQEKPLDPAMAQEDPMAQFYRVEVSTRIYGRKINTPTNRNDEDDPHCRPLSTPQVVSHVPREAITLVDKPHSTDQTLPHAFRQVMGLPLGTFPQTWFDRQHPGQESDFNLSPLNVGEVVPLTWKKNGRRVSNFAHRVGLPPALTDALRSFSDDMGITDIARSLVGSQPVPRGEVKLHTLQGQEWYVQRPKDWPSDYHWIETADEAAHEHFLQVLRQQGHLDVVLHALGETFPQLQALSVYHLSFNVVSYASEGWYHFDFTNSGGKAFNLLVPILLGFDGSPPELVVRQDGDDQLEGMMKYQYNVGMLNGEFSKHATAATNLKASGEFRLMASIYIADITEENVDSIIGDFSNYEYPTRDREYMLSRSGLHWKRGQNGAGATAPAISPPANYVPGGGGGGGDDKYGGSSSTASTTFDDMTDDMIEVNIPRETHFLQNELQPGEVSPIRWKDGKRVSKFAHRVGLPPQLTEELRAYSDEIGITELVRNLTARGMPLERGEIKNLVMGGQNWIVQRPTNWPSDFHWIETADTACYEDFLGVLAKGGFEQILRGVGEEFPHLETLAIFQLSFNVVSVATEGWFHFDFTKAKGKAFNLLVPLYLGNDSPPELTIRQDGSKDVKGNLKYEYDVGLLNGEYNSHATAATNLRKQGETRIMVSIYLGDIEESILEEIMKDYSNFRYPPHGDGIHLLQQRGRHWTREDGPRLHVPGDFGDFVRPKLMPGELAPLKWKKNGRRVSNYAYQVGIPPEMMETLSRFTDIMGITSMARSLAGPLPLEEGEARFVRTNMHNWYAHRSEEDWEANIHWIETADEKSHEELLAALEQGGLYKILDSLGKRLNLDSLVCYHLCFVVVSQCSRGFMHYDFTNTGGKAFNLYIPIHLVDNSAPEWEFEDDNSSDRGKLKMEYGVGLVVGDDTNHMTAPIDYREKDEMRLMASIYVADVNEDNVDRIMEEYANYAYPPHDEAEFLLEQRGRHWTRENAAEP